MSVSIKYKGTEIASASTEVTKTIKTAGKYCEADILVENTPDGGDAPVINPLSVTANGTYTAPSGVDGYSPVTVNVPQGITPTGKKLITDTSETDVAAFATAQVSSDTLLAENIKKDVNILGVVGSFEGGGTTITDGIVVKARNANGRITEVEKYGDCGAYEFGIASMGFRDFPFGYTTKVTLHNCTELGDGVFYNRFITQIIGLENITRCGTNCFLNSGLTSISLPNVTYVGATCFRALYSTTSVVLPIITNYDNYIFQSSTTLQTVQIGSIGNQAPTTDNQPFYGCTQAGLTITAYSSGAKADTLVSNYRRNATNATIIIKASEATTYNGVSYAAGDTMITSEVA